MPQDLLQERVEQWIKAQASMPVAP